MSVRGWMVSGLLLLQLAGCVTPAVKSRLQLPGWVAEPKSADSVYAYMVGSSTGSDTEVLAREKAIRNAIDHAIKGIGAGVSLTEEEFQFLSRVELGGVELVPGCVHYEPNGGRIDCWVQISYPLSERARVLKQYELGKALRVKWDKARVAYARGEFEVARSVGVEVIQGITSEMILSFDPDDVKFLVAESCREQKDFQGARRWYESVEKTTRKDARRQEVAGRIAALPKPARFWPMNERFGGMKVALVCAVREGKGCERSTDLVGLFGKECREAGLVSADIMELVGAESVAALFDRREFGVVSQAAAGAGAGVVLAVLMDIDPVKREAVRSGGDTSGLVIDTYVKYLVIRVKDGVCVFDGAIKETIGNSSVSAVATHAVSVMIQNYLVPKCPAVESGAK